MNTKVAFRTDASAAIGTGHVMRCLTLAEALRERGADARFICREHDGNLCALIEQRSFAVDRLPMGRADGKRAEDAPPHALWLGAGWEEDAEGTRAAIRAGGSVPDWLVVDHYALDVRWERELRTAARQIMAIDDLADRDHDCDLLLDQNLIDGQDERYREKVPDGCVLLLGPAYALLQPDYALLREQVQPRQGPVRRVLVYFGGVDTDDLTIKAVDALLALGRPEIEADIVLSPASSQFPRVQDRISGRPGLRLHAHVPSLAPLMAAADLAIGASGATSWERLCLGLPALVVTVAENQRPIAAALAGRGLVRWLGHAGEVGEADIHAALRGVVACGQDSDWSGRCREIVDGHGRDRVRAALSQERRHGRLASVEAWS